MDRLLVALLSAFDAAHRGRRRACRGARSPDARVGHRARRRRRLVGPLAGQRGRSGSWAIWCRFAITLDDHYVAEAGIDVDAAAFTLSLAPLAFAALHGHLRRALRCPRGGCGRRGSPAWSSGALVYGAIATAVVAHDREPDRPAVTLAGGAAALRCSTASPRSAARSRCAWRAATTGSSTRPCATGSSRSRDGWGEVPALVARGTAIALAGLVGRGIRPARASPSSSAAARSSRSTSPRTSTRSARPS